MGPKGERAHFPGVTGSTAPCAELFVTKNCQCVGWQRPCTPAKAGKRRGEQKEGWRARRKLHLLQHSTVCGQGCRSYKGLFQSYTNSLSIFPFQSRCLVKCPLRHKYGKAALFPPLVKQPMYLMLISWHF